MNNRVALILGLSIWLYGVSAWAAPSPASDNSLNSTSVKAARKSSSPSTVSLAATGTSNATPAPSAAPKPAGSPAPATIPAPTPTPVPEVKVLISVPDQKLAVLVNDKVYRTYKVSTSRYGEGDNFGSWRTPLGRLQVAGKIGFNQPVGAVFHRRQPTGEILVPNAPGRDPIVSRIIWLKGLEPTNRFAFQRCIYIHGTPQESSLGRKASFGCVRMRSVDVVEVFNSVGLGTEVSIVSKPIKRAVRDLEKGALIAKNVQREASQAIGQAGAGR